MKKTTKTSAPASYKSTNKSGLRQVLEPIKSYLSELSRENNIRLSGLTVTGDTIRVTAETVGARSRCPCCGTVSRHVHSRCLRRLQCTELLDHSLVLTLRVRHFRCSNPECGRSIFSEPLRLASPYMRMTHGVRRRMLHESLNQSAPRAVDTLRTEHISVSASTCQRAVRRLGASNPHVRTSGYVGIDDFARRKGHTYMCGIVDHYTGDVLAVFGTRYGEEIAEWFRSHPEIRLVTRDGSPQYASLIRDGCPQATQVSDRFHLIKNMRDVSVGIMRELLGSRASTVPYPRPTEREARECVFYGMVGMGVERHRCRVRDFYSVMELKGRCMSVRQTAEALCMSPQRVHKLLHTDISRVLSDDQKVILRNLDGIAAAIGSGLITPEAVFRRMGGAVPSRLIHRVMRPITAKYSDLRRTVRECNRNMCGEGDVKVTDGAIWRFILTGRTESGKLKTIGQTHPLAARVAQVCIRFCRMIRGEDDAPDVDRWIREAWECGCEELKDFAEYIRKDRDAVEQAYLTNYSNAIMEGNVNRAKAIKRSMYNRADTQALRAKMIFAGRNEALKYHLN